MEASYLLLDAQPDRVVSAMPMLTIRNSSGTGLNLRESPAKSSPSNNPDATDRLHLRASASENAASLGKYYNGVQVIIDGPVDAAWTKVIIGNLKGYMKTK